ncbi:hypothetical protein scyTo_0021995 [Scyliorhinus torazame]|uniref:Small nuclear ribonucleoprotein G n=1 Tax=Scyliorhinus torazame TaxID=75743 RepID=A0A401QAN6_SCYTO|nr:hypothetical protein [Scyliorhinus torazame]
MFIESQNQSLSAEGGHWLTFWDSAVSWEGWKLNTAEPLWEMFMDKKLSLKLNGGRHVQGILRGFDPFMNLVVDESVEMAPGGQQNIIGMVVIRGNSIIMLEALERV